MDRPFFSICIPQYNRVQYLQKALQSIKRQLFTDYEVVVSDDCSTDETAEIIPPLLKQLFPRAVYVRTPKNLGYDGNLRSAMTTAMGRFVFFLGNDDEIADPSLLGDAAALLRADPSIGVVVGNYRDWKTGRPLVVNFTTSKNLGSGATIACTHFRQFVNVSGQILDLDLCHRNATDKWDGTTWYQVYHACKILAHGRTFYAWSRFTSNRDIEINGEISEGQFTKAALTAIPLEIRQVGISSLCRVALDAVSDYCSREQLRRCAAIVTKQAVLLTYPYWLTRYRRYRSYIGALGIALGMWPPLFLDTIDLRWTDRVRVWCYYAFSTCAGLCMPLSLLEWAVRKCNSEGAAAPGGKR
jgi:glycosyltransferase involved in cell wall biosynthesis